MTSDSTSKLARANKVRGLATGHSPFFTRGLRNASKARSYLSSLTCQGSKSGTRLTTFRTPTPFLTNFAAGDQHEAAFFTGAADVKVSQLFVLAVRDEAPQSKSPAQAALGINRKALEGR